MKAEEALLHLVGVLAVDLIISELDLSSFSPSSSSSFSTSLNIVSAFKIASLEIVTGFKEANLNDGRGIVKSGSLVSTVSSWKLSKSL